MKIIVAKMKHDNAYISFADPAKAYLKLFELYNDSEYYQFDHEYLEEEIAKAQAELGDLASAQSPRMIEEKQRKERQLRDLQRQAADARKQQELYDRAKAGDAAAAEKLLKLRNGHEYEGWNVEHVYS